MVLDELKALCKTRLPQISHSDKNYDYSVFIDAIKKIKWTPELLHEFMCPTTMCASHTYMRPEIFSGNSNNMKYVSGYCIPIPGTPFNRGHYTLDGTCYVLHPNMIAIHNLVEQISGMKYAYKSLCIAHYVISHNKCIVTRFPNYLHLVRRKMLNAKKISDGDDIRHLHILYDRLTVEYYEKYYEISYNSPRYVEGWYQDPYDLLYYKLVNCDTYSVIRSIDCGLVINAKTNGQYRHGIKRVVQSGSIYLLKRMFSQEMIDKFGIMYDQKLLNDSLVCALRKNNSKEIVVYLHTLGARLHRINPRYNYHDTLAKILEEFQTKSVAK